MQTRHLLLHKLKKHICKWNIVQSKIDADSLERITKSEIGRRNEAKKEFVSFKRGMSPKKLHEVVNFSYFIQEKYDNFLKESTSCVIDIGSGLGYLDQFLCYIYGYQVIGIESCSNHSNGADKRNSYFSAVDKDNRYNIKRKSSGKIILIISKWAIY